MNTREAIQAMLDGKKVRGAQWEDGYYISFVDNAGFVDENLSITDITIEDKWEIYEEPKQKQNVTIEKWLCKYGFNFSYKLIVIEMCSTNNMEGYTKVKLLDTYEVEL